jgi:chromate transporter
MPDVPSVTRSRVPTDPSLGEVALVFFKLGTIAFGGPAAHIALMEQEFVVRRQWLTREAFLDRLGAANLLPGPSSTEMAIFIGYEKRGLPGLLTAGICFIVPAALLVSAIASLYLRYAGLPAVEGVLYALKPVVIAVIADAFWRLARDAVKSRCLALAGLVAAALYAIGTGELIALGVAALIGTAPRWIPRAGDETKSLLILMLGASFTAKANTIGGYGLGKLFLVFARIGAVLFGSGYVLLAFLRTDLVDHLHWLTERQLLDAVAVGQITPGPLFTTATFIGYIIGGPSGAAAATVGIFLPAFFFVGISSRVLPLIRRSLIAASLLDGVIVGSLGLMGVVACRLGTSSIVDLPTFLIAAGSIVLLRLRMNSAWLIAAAALFGWLIER